MEIQVKLGTLATVHLIRRLPQYMLHCIKRKTSLLAKCFYRQLIQGMNNNLDLTWNKNANKKSKITIKLNKTDSILKKKPSLSLQIVAKEENKKSKISMK